MMRRQNSLFLLCLGVLLAVSAPLAANGGEIGPASVRSVQGQAVPGGGPELLPTWSSGLSFPPGEGRVRYAWAQCPSMPDSVFIFSGVSEAGSVTDTSWRYDADSDNWDPPGPYPHRD